MSSVAVQIHKLLDTEKPFVVYRQPESRKIKIIIQRDSELHFASSGKNIGFVMAPFDTNNKSILFPKNQTTRYSIKYDSKIIAPITKTEYIEKMNKERVYLKLLKKTLGFINSGFFNKVVLSRVIEKKYDTSKIGAIYENLLHAYSNAFVYVWFHPKKGLWIGASPEKLATLKGNEFSTMSLAGTQVFKDNIIWKKKEQEEQQWVTDYITTRLSPLVDTMSVSKPYTLKVGNLSHICSEIKGQMKSSSNLQNLVSALHPTPAVCGVPLKAAKTFIHENEGYEREFYTGYLGEILSENDATLYVNLRCMQLTPSLAKTYVGGGVTKDSIPEKEWEETLNKSNVLGDFF